MKKKMKVIIGVVCTVIAVAAVSTIIALTAQNKGPFLGTVTDGATGNPIANVSVSDGLNVVKTDENGKYKLDGWRKSHFVTVTVPSGYETEAYYIPVEKAKESYDFVLDKTENTDGGKHSFLQISDTEIGEDGTGEWLDNLKNIVKQTNPAFLIHTGDICYEPGLKKHIEQMNTQTMGCNVKYVIGNHDYVAGKYGEELYESLYGPVWYSFEVGNVHYVITSFQTGSDYKSFYNKNDRWRWLKNDLENVDSDKKVIMFNHTKSPSDDYVLSFGREELDLKKHNLIACVFGHYHYNYVCDTQGVLNISAPRPDCGGIDSSAAGARLITVSDDGTITTQMKYYDLGKSTQPQKALYSKKLDGNVLFCDTVSDGAYAYTASVDDDYPNDGSRVYCIDKKDAKTVWSYKTENSVKNNVVLCENSIVAQDADGNIYCLDKTDGTLLWQKKIELGNTIGTSSALCVENGVIYAGNSRIVTALEAQTGKIIWSTNRDKGENSPAQFVVCDDRLLVSSHWDSLCALSIKDGSELWSNDDGDIRFRSSTPLYTDGKLLVADSSAIMLADPANGEITSKKNYEEYNFSSSAQPICRDGIAYIPTADNGLVAYDMSKNEIIWSCKTGENILFTAPYVGKGKSTVESTPVFSGDNLVFGVNDGLIYCVNAKTGKIVKTYHAGSAVLGKVYIEKNKIYAGTFDGYFVCFEE